MSGRWRAALAGRLRVVTSQDLLTAAPDEPRSGRRQHLGPWTVLVVGALVFVVAVFAVSRLGAERGNHARFQFPDRLMGVKILSPDRAPEARGRQVVARYDRRGDGVAGLVVSWLPESELADVVAEPAMFAGEDRIRCAEDDGAVCVFRKRDGWVRVSQSQSPVEQVRRIAEEFLASMKEPDSVG